MTLISWKDFSGNGMFLYNEVLSIGDGWCYLGHPSYPWELSKKPKVREFVYMRRSLRIRDRTKYQFIEVFCAIKDIYTRTKATEYKLRRGIVNRNLTNVTSSKFKIELSRRIKRVRNYTINAPLITRVK